MIIAITLLSLSLSNLLTYYILMIAAEQVSSHRPV